MLHIDLETFSSVDLTKSGAHKYVASPDFEILLLAYSYDDEATQIVDLASGEKLPKKLAKDIQNGKVQKAAHNAAFERLCLQRIGLITDPEHWACTAILASHAGLPLSLQGVSEALKLVKGKDPIGKRLIKFFCCPRKPTKSDPSTRNYPEFNPEKWEQFKNYCIRDVDAEKEIYRRLKRFEFPEVEKRYYRLDQFINDRGVAIDTAFADSAIALSEEYNQKLIGHIKELTGLRNPNSVTELKAWLGNATGREIKTLSKDTLPELLKDASGDVREVLLARQELGKSSISKYKKMIDCAGFDGRARGLLQFYATRTARWAGRLIQMQNLPQNHLPDLDTPRDLIRLNDLESFAMAYPSPPAVLSQLIRTAIVAPKGCTLGVADYSAIEARVIAWIAGERWRLEVFNTHGKIYEASASAMFGVPIQQVTKGSDLRQKGKVAELALGYQGGWSALKKMGGEKMGLTAKEMKNIVTLWRKASPAIVETWENFEACAHKAVATKTKIVSRFKGIAFEGGRDFMRIILPSGRAIYYREPKFGTNRFGKPALTYMGVDAETKKWVRLETYGGKLAENIVQAVARDVLAGAIYALYRAGFKTVFHVHDEVINEFALCEAEADLQEMCKIMTAPQPWTKGLPLRAEGYLTEYYKKD